MYEAYYGLREKPFSLLPDPDFLYLGRRHALALSLLEYGVTSGAPVSVITGEVGAGKTTLVRRLLDLVGDDVRVGLITNTHADFGELLQWVALAFALPWEGRAKPALYQGFVDFLVREYSARRRCVLIVDEAQNLAVEALEELRLLSNVNADKHQVLQLVLTGQPELRDRLRRDDLRQFRQRVSVDYHLGALAAQETGAYIAHRLTVAGGAADLFEPDACLCIHEAAHGIPRLVNVLCDLALVYGYAARCPRIGADLAGEVLRDRAEHGALGAWMPGRGDAA